MMEDIRIEDVNEEARNYIFGNLSHKEKKEFELLLEENPSLKADVNFIKEYVIFKQKEKENELRKTIESVLKEEKLQQNTKTIYAGASVALLSFVFCLIIYGFSPPSNNNKRIRLFIPTNVIDNHSLVFKGMEVKQTGKGEMIKIKLEKDSTAYSEDTYYFVENRNDSCLLYQKKLLGSEKKTIGNKVITGEVIFCTERYYNEYNYRPPKRIVETSSEKILIALNDKCDFNSTEVVSFDELIFTNMYFNR